MLTGGPCEKMTDLPNRSEIIFAMNAPKWSKGDGLAGLQGELSESLFLMILKCWESLIFRKLFYDRLVR